MPILSAGSNVTLSVAAGQILTVQSDQATYDFENPVGTRIGEYAYDNVFGPFSTAGSVKLTSVQGQLFYDLSAGQSFNSQYNPANVAITGGTMAGVSVATLAAASGRTPSAQLRVAPIGDSITNITSSPGYDFTKATTALSGGLFLANKMGAALPIASNGACRIIGNFGISGQTSAQLLARDTAAASTTRAAISDAASLNADIAIVSIGINDIQASISATSTAAQINTFLTGTLYPNITAVLKRIKALGMWPVYQSLGGYGPVVSGVTQADLDARCAVVKTANAYIQGTLIPSLGFGTFADVYSVSADPITGYWKTGYSNDGLHPSIVGAPIQAQALWAAIQAKFLPYSRGVYCLPVSGSSQNAFPNPTLLNATSGLATGITTADLSSTTNTVVASINEYENTLWQEFRVTPGTVDANNTAFFSINIRPSIIGGSPLVNFAAGELLGCECDVWIDDGNGGAPLAFVNLGVRSRMFYAAGASSSLYDTSGNGVALANLVATPYVFRGKAVTLPHAAPDSSANMTDATFTLIAVATPGTYRIRIANIRIVKLPTNY